jgi:hypothetical protein
MPIDYKKSEKQYYQPKTTPSLIQVPKMVFIAVDGKGDPNTCEAYKNAMELLYGLSYSIKMSKMSGTQPQGYFEYVVPPLEGLWWSEGEYFDGKTVMPEKDKFCWTSMIRQPDFVTQEVLEQAKEVLLKKKPLLDLSLARLISFTEGLCVQVMHIGSYDDEPMTIATMEQYAIENGYVIDINDTRRHHEIYLSDPRRVPSEKLKTVIRHPIRKA